MIHITVLEPEGMPIFEKYDAWIEEIPCSTGKYVPQLRGIFSILDTRITFPARDGNGAPYPPNPWGFHLLGGGDGRKTSPWGYLPN